MRNTIGACARRAADRSGNTYQTEVCYGLLSGDVVLVTIAVTCVTDAVDASGL
jgi:hypothetical protein